MGSHFPDLACTFSIALRDNPEQIEQIVSRQPEKKAGLDCVKNMPIQNSQSQSLE
jgi:hypothetical protein